LLAPDCDPLDSWGQATSEVRHCHELEFQDPEAAPPAQSSGSGAGLPLSLVGFLGLFFVAWIILILIILIVLTVL
jgi:hypothetical protein